MDMNKKWLISALVLLASGATFAQSGGKTVRICDDSGCSDRPSNSATFDPTRDDTPEETKRVAALENIARKDPRAAYDLGLRFFRGDGVRQDSHLALQWMRDAGDRGVLPAQAALGRFYLAGLQEMGADPAEAERWLSMAADRGDQESAKLLPEARKAKQDEQALYRWREAHRKHWYGWWYSGYPYYWTWGPVGWVIR
jgi:TPR repeat protein